MVRQSKLTRLSPIGEAIKVNKTLTNFDLSNNDISDGGAASIAEAIKINNTVTNLHLTRNGIIDLNLAFHYISDVSATSIAEAIKVNKTHLFDFGFR